MPLRTISRVGRALIFVLAIGCSTPVTPASDAGQGRADTRVDTDASADASADVSADAGVDAGADVDPGLPDSSAYGLRRLTLPQLQNSLHDLLGASILVPADLEADTYGDDFASVGMASLAISVHAFEQFDDAAYAVAHQAMTVGAARAALVGCSPAGVTDDACATTFVRAFGRRAWRRPLTDAEVDRYAGIARQAAAALGDFHAGLEQALAGLLLSPNFLYIVQVGEVDPARPTQRRYTAYEMAARLSFFFWDTTPDETLLGAAARGELSTPDGVRAQAQRMLEDPRGRAVIVGFFSALFGLRWLPFLQRDPMLFPQFRSPTFSASVLQQTIRDIEDRVFVSDGDFRGFFDASTTFVNAELAQLYGLPPVTAPGFVQVALPADGPRAGLLGYAGFESMYSHDATNSPTLRGFVVRRSLLCQTIPLPSQDVRTNIPDADPASPTTLRQRLSLHRQSPACASCHEQMDPIGFALENFDPGGGWRATDNGLPIDASGDLDGVPFSGPRGLATALHDHPDVPGCFVRRLFRYSTGQQETAADVTTLDGLTRRFAANGYRVRGFLVDFVASDAFRLLTPAP